MKFHTQTILHDPENGLWGNCFQTALACVLDMEVEEVPHFYDQGNTSIDPIQKWLLQFNLCLVTIGHAKDHDWFAESGLTEVVTISGGPSPRYDGKVDHCVVARGGRMLHDPHPSRDGVPEFTHHWFLAAVSPAWTKKWKEIRDSTLENT